MIKISHAFLLMVLVIGCKQAKQEEPLPNYQSNPFLEVSRDQSQYFDQDRRLVQFLRATPQEIEAVKNAEDELKINYGWSFGMCFGFCERAVELSSQGVLLESKRWEDDFVKTECREISEQEYNDLIASIDFKAFTEFNADLGCGDCADGGAEWLVIERTNLRKAISGTYGYSVEPVQALLDYFRSIN